MNMKFTRLGADIRFINTYEGLEVIHSITIRYNIAFLDDEGRPKYDIGMEARYVAESDIVEIDLSQVRHTDASKVRTIVDAVNTKCNFEANEIIRRLTKKGVK